MLVVISSSIYPSYAFTCYAARTCNTTAASHAAATWNNISYLEVTSFACSVARCFERVGFGCCCTVIVYLKVIVRIICFCTIQYFIIEICEICDSCCYLDSIARFFACYCSRTFNAYRSFGAARNCRTARR